MAELTYESMFRFLNTASQWAARQSALAKAKAKADGDPLWEHKVAPNTKLAYAIERVKPRVEKLTRQYQAAIDDLNIDHCEVDKDGAIIVVDGQYSFKPASKKARNKAQEELTSKVVEIEPYWATKLPNDLTVAEAVAFEGFVLKDAEACSEEVAEAVAV